MYGKIFTQIYHSTLAADWKALVTFQQLLVLCDADGVVDMTLDSIHRITNLPLDILAPGLEALTNPDPQSRSTAEEGRRIVLLDAARAWGWRIVNHHYYRNVMTREDKRRKERERIASKRARKPAAPPHGTPPTPVKLPHGEFGRVRLTETEWTGLGAALSERGRDALMVELDQYLESTGKHYKSHYATLKAWARKRPAPPLKIGLQPGVILE